jgi:hypothetical protein
METYALFTIELDKIGGPPDAPPLSANLKVVGSNLVTLCANYDPMKDPIWDPSHVLPTAYSKPSAPSTWADVLQTVERYEAQWSNLTAEQYPESSDERKVIGSLRVSLQPYAEKTSRCAHCGTVAQCKRCSACKVVRYCSPACSKSGWAVHKK